MVAYNVVLVYLNPSSFAKDLKLFGLTFSFDPRRILVLVSSRAPLLPRNQFLLMLEMPLHIFWVHEFEQGLSIRPSGPWWISLSSPPLWPPSLEQNEQIGKFLLELLHIHRSLFQVHEFRLFIVPCIGEEVLLIELFLELVPSNWPSLYFVV